MEACLRERPNADLQRQEVIVLEKEAVTKPFWLGRLPHSSGGCYKRRFSGVLSREKFVR